MSIAVAHHLMAELKLLGMSAAFDKAAIDATQHQWSCAEFFDVLLQAEADVRQERKISRLIKTAGFTVKAAFEDFDYAAKRSITKAQIKDLYSLDWLRQGRPLLLVGQTGVGKTFIAQAAGRHACYTGKSALFMTVSEWQENLALARSSGTYLKMRDRLARPDVLIIDNFGMRKLTAMEAQDLCEILEERTGAKSTVFTTQLPLTHWAEVIADPVIADAIRDRLEHAALTIEITGESYRGVKARQLASQTNNS
jgi:DNA replication protein DnaC